MKEIITALEKANMQLTSLGVNNTNFCTDAIKLANELARELDSQKSPSKEIEAQKELDLSDKPLPCPFCGGIAEIEDQIDMYDFGDCRITCTTCMARSDVYTSEDGDRIKRAITSWNTRAPSKQLTGAQQALDIALKQLVTAKEAQELAESIASAIEEGSAEWENDYKQAMKKLEKCKGALQYYANGGDWINGEADQGTAAKAALASIKE